MVNLTKLGIQKQNFLKNVPHVPMNNGESQEKKTHNRKKISRNYLGDGEENGGIGGEENNGGSGEIGGGIGKNWGGEEKPIKCRYGGEIRSAHPAACEWHRMEKDEVCRESKCPRMSLGWG